MIHAHPSNQPSETSLGNSSRIILIPALLLGMLLVLPSCSSKKDPWNRGAVKGQVTLDSKPLEEGEITFYPMDTKGTPAGGKIKLGAYDIPLKSGPVAGRNRVEIRSVRKTGRLIESTVVPEGDGQFVPGQKVEEFKEFVPKQYNSESTLTATIEADAANEVNFELVSEGKKT